MEELKELVWGRTPITKYNMPLVLDHYNELVLKINEIIGNTLSTENDTTGMKYIKVCTQEEYDALNSSNYSNYDITLFFII